MAGFRCRPVGRGVRVTGLFHILNTDRALVDGLHDQAVAQLGGRVVQFGKDDGRAGVRAQEGGRGERLAVVVDEAGEREAVTPADVDGVDLLDVLPVEPELDTVVGPRCAVGDDGLAAGL